MKMLPNGGNHRPFSEEDLRRDLKCEVLTAHWYQLVKFLTPDRHYPYLRSRYILSGADCKEIDHCVTDEAKATRFLDVVKSKGAAGYDALCESLKLEKTQLFLLRQLNQDFERRWIAYLELKRGQTPGLDPITPPDVRPSPPPRLLNLKPPQPVEHLEPSPPPSPNTRPGSQCQEGGRQSVDVAHILQSLAVREEEHGRTHTQQASSLPPSAFPSMPSGLSTEVQAPSLAHSPYDLSSSASDPASTLSSPTQDSTDAVSDHSIRPSPGKLCTRGSSDSFPLSQEGQIPVTPRVPEESEDPSSWSKSLPDDSLAPSSPAVISGRPILCGRALADQNQAWGKCLEDKENSTGEDNDSTDTDCPLNQHKQTHATAVKVVSSSELENCEESSCDVSLPTGNHCADSASKDDCGGEPDSMLAEGSRGSGFQVVGGQSLQSRQSVHDREGRGVNSTQC